MAYCTNCGAEFDGKFCPKCGTPSPPQGGPSAGQGGPPPGSGAPSSAGAMTDNVAGTLCYVLGLITGILFLVLEPYSRNRKVRFHAFQFIFLSVALIVLQIALNIIMPWTVSLFVGPLIGLAALVLWIFMLVKTYQDQKVVLPIIGPMAEKQA